MGKKKLNNQNSTEISEGANKESRNIKLGLSWRERPINDTYLQDMAEALEEWALNSNIDKDKPYSLEAFYQNDPYRISTQTFAEWRTRYKRLDEAAEFAKEIIGRRRFEITFEMKRDRTLFCITQPDYDSSWREKQRNYAQDTKVSNTPTQQGPTVIYMSSKAAEQVGLEVNEDKR